MLPTVTDDHRQQARRMFGCLEAEDGAHFLAKCEQLQADVKRLETENEEDDNEWKRIVYYLVDAVHAQRGKSIPEDVEHAKAEIDRLRAIVDKRP